MTEGDIMGYRTGLQTSAEKDGLEWLLDQAEQNVGQRIPEQDYNKFTYAAAVVWEYHRLKEEYQQYIDS